MNLIDLIRIRRKLIIKSNICFFLIILFPQFLALDIDLMKNNQTFIIYGNNTLDDHFVYNKQQDICDCSPKMVYYENEDRNHTILSLKNTRQELNNYIPTTNEFTLNNYTLKSTNEIIKTNLDIKKYNDSIILDIEHYCILEVTANYENANLSQNLYLKNSNIDSRNYWGVIQLELYLSDISDKIKIEFVKFCKPPNLMGSIITAILLFTIATIFVIISSYSEISLELTEIKQHGELKYWHGIIFIISGSAVLILIFYLIEYINVIFTLLISFQITLALFLTLKTLYEYLNFHKNYKFKYFNKQIKFLKQTLKIELEIYTILLIIFTITLVIIYLYTKHWILNNIFGFALVFTILSLFHVRSFKICAVLLFSAFLYDVFWVYISPYIFTQNVMVVAATSLNMPIKLEMPIFFDSHPLKSCMFLGLGDLVLPGFVLKFCHRFDFIKKSSVYYKTSILLYVTALAMSGIVIAIFNYPQPVLFYMCPVILGGIMLTAYYRNEMDIWNADLLEENMQYGDYGNYGNAVGEVNNNIEVNNMEERSYVNHYDNFGEVGDRNEMNYGLESIDSNTHE